MLTEAELLKSLLDALRPEGADGMSMEEISEIWGVGPKTARQRVKRLIQTGRMRHAGWRTAVNISGLSCRVPVYLPIVEEEKDGSH